MAQIAAHHAHRQRLFSLVALGDGVGTLPRLPRRPDSAAKARSWVRDELRHHDLPQDVRDDAELVISELVTHAVLHTTGDTVSCEARVLSGCVHLEVRDQGQASAGGGCGLLLVDRIAESCGIRPAKDGEGHAVWATLTFRPHSRSGGNAAIRCAGKRK